MTSTASCCVGRVGGATHVVQSTGDQDDGHGKLLCMWHRQHNTGGAELLLEVKTTSTASCCVRGVGATTGGAELLLEIKRTTTTSWCLRSIGGAAQVVQSCCWKSRR
jgi:hypothetical protein